MPNAFDAVPLVTPERDGELLAETLALRDDVRELRAILAQVSIDLCGLPRQPRRPCARHPASAVAD